ncbi:hypothetical protein LWI29_026200 [Acer saccharum]|uniref:Uncharacterized protein n=1 Tax=Acer saccharum TaxID=4024 RepID=A0AA39RSU9_ACESA|nr:hypothetical protein LWI29_026200 [Acer saccharum]
MKTSLPLKMENPYLKSLKVGELEIESVSRFMRQDFACTGCALVFRIGSSKFFALVALRCSVSKASICALDVLRCSILEALLFFATVVLRCPTLGAFNLCTGCALVLHFGVLCSISESLRSSWRVLMHSRWCAPLSEFYARARVLLHSSDARGESFALEVLCCQFWRSLFLVAIAGTLPL